MLFELKGRIYYIGEKLSEKQEIGITIMENCPYPNLMFEAWGTVVPKLEDLQREMLVNVKFEIQGKTYQGKDGNMRSFTVMKIADIEAVPEVISENKQ